jgi:hypothetical protein
MATVNVVSEKGHSLTHEVCIAGAIPNSIATTSKKQIQSDR